MRFNVKKNLKNVVPRCFIRNQIYIQAYFLAFINLTIDDLNYFPQEKNIKLELCCKFLNKKLTTQKKTTNAKLIDISQQFVFE